MEDVGAAILGWEMGWRGWVWSVSFGLGDDCAGGLWCLRGDGVHEQSVFVISHTRCVILEMDGFLE